MRQHNASFNKGKITEHAKVISAEKRNEIKITDRFLYTIRAGEVHETDDFKYAVVNSKRLG